MRQAAELVAAQLVSAWTIGAEVKLGREPRRGKIAQSKLRQREIRDVVTAREHETHLGSQWNVDFTFGR
jgi:hypothetical protein